MKTRAWIGWMLAVYLGVPVLLLGAVAVAQAGPPFLVQRPREEIEADIDDLVTFYGIPNGAFALELVELEILLDIRDRLKERPLRED